MVLITVVVINGNDNDNNFFIHEIKISKIVLHKYAHNLHLMNMNNFSTKTIYKYKAALSLIFRI